VVKAFGQTVCSYPFIIDYTWHQIAELEIVKPGYSFHRSPQYWPDHFNYMVFKPWHDMLLEQNTNKQLQYITEIKKQILIKARTIDELRTVFQKDGRDVIFPERSASIGSLTYARRLFGPQYHLLGQVWYLYAKLNATFDEIDAEHFRLMYPQWSIGKLRAGEVSNLQQIPINVDETEFRYEFDLYNMSIYMKLDEGSYVLLLHDEERNQYVDPLKHRIIIEKMSWQTDHFHVISEDTENKLDPPAEFPTWFLFPNSSDPWSRKLYVPPEDRKKSTKLGLLDRENFGTSWLGQYLAFCWGLLPDQKFPKALQTAFALPEIYLFAPKFLPRESEMPNLLQPLQTQISVAGFRPDESQHKAINCALNETICAIQGPPGTGKTQTIVALLDEFLLRFRQSNPDNAPHILISALSYAAMTEVLHKLMKAKDDAGNPLPIVEFPQIFARSRGEDPRLSAHDLVYDSSWRLDNKKLAKKDTLETVFPKGFVMFANAHILYSIGHSKITHSDFHFDLIVVDEASQLPVDHFMAALQFVNHITGLVPCTIMPPDAKHKFGVVQPAPPLTFGKRTQVVIVGDHNQLPPVQQVEPPYNLRCVLNSLFSYYVGTEALQGHGIPYQQLTVNYRSNQQIVDYTNQLDCYDKEIQSHSHNAAYHLHGPCPAKIDPWIATLLDPTKIVCALIHDSHFETSVSGLEAEIVAKVIWGYYETVKSTLASKTDEENFWDKIVGVVAPHNAQCHLIRRNIMILIQPLHLSIEELQVKVQHCVASVDKFQGSERELIVSSIGISAKEQLQSEETFIYELTRFNVLTSRAKSKILVITSRNFLQYIPNDRETMESAAKIRQFTLGFCCRSQSLTVPFNGQDHKLEFRYK